MLLKTNIKCNHVNPNQKTKSKLNQLIMLYKGNQQLESPKDK